MRKKDVLQVFILDYTYKKQPSTNREPKNTTEEKRRKTKKNGNSSPPTTFIIILTGTLTFY